jgi:hypothetical protein
MILCRGSPPTKEDPHVQEHSDPPLRSRPFGHALPRRLTRSHEDLAREKLPNDIGIELLGKSVLYSFYYQHNTNRYVGLDVGLSALGGGSGSDNTSIIFLPIGAKFYAVPKNGTFFVSGGIVFLAATTNSGPFDSDSSSGSYGYVGPGFEFRSESGFLFRGMAYSLIFGGGFFVWPGLSVGYAF